MTYIRFFVLLCTLSIYTSSYGKIPHKNEEKIKESYDLTLEYSDPLTNHTLPLHTRLDKNIFTEDDFVKNKLIAGFTKEDVLEKAILSANVYVSGTQDPITKKNTPFEMTSMEVQIMETYLEKGYAVRPFFSEREHSGLFISKIDTINHTALIEIAYHGTDAWYHWGTNLNALKTDASWLPKDFEGDLVYAHQGFIQGVNASWDVLHSYIIETLYQCYQKGINRDQVHFVFTGHSMGAANATLAALRTVKGTLEINPKNISVITFESPRVFNPAGAKAYDALLGERTLRVFNPNDIVPRLSPTFLDFSHVGKTLIVEGDYGIGTFIKSHFMKNVYDALEQQKPNAFLSLDSAQETNGKPNPLISFFNRSWDKLFGRKKPENDQKTDFTADQRMKFPALDEIRTEIRLINTQIEQAEKTRNEEKADTLKTLLQAKLNYEKYLRMHYRFSIPIEEVRRLFEIYVDRKNADKKLEKIQAEQKKIDADIKIYTQKINVSKTLTENATSAEQNKRDEMIKKRNLLEDKIQEITIFKLML